MKITASKLRFAVLFAIFLGFAPFYPQPHIVGKIKWLLGGGIGMTPVDYFDVALHGLPWVYLLVVTWMYVRQQQNNKG